MADGRDMSGWLVHHPPLTLNKGGGGLHLRHKAGIGMYLAWWLYNMLYNMFYRDIWAWPKTLVWIVPRCYDHDPYTMDHGSDQALWFTQLVYLTQPS